MAFVKILNVSFCILVVICSSVKGSENDCIFKTNERGWYCVCDLQNCDDIQAPYPTEAGQVLLIRTSSSGERLNQVDVNAPQDGDESVPSMEVDLFINTSSRQHKVEGFGGSFTDTFGYNLHSISNNLADQIINDYFGANGSRYNLARTVIGGSDFSLRGYSYDDTEFPDYELEHWNLQPEDYEYKIPYIKRAIELVEGRGEELKLLSSPWTPPKWMKTRNKYDGGGFKSDPMVYQSYANYLVKFFDAYKEFGINFWATTIQNEPMIGYTPPQITGTEADEWQLGYMLSNYIGPTLHAHNYTKENLKILVGDDLAAHTTAYVDYSYRHEEIAKYISGYCYHFYTLGGITAHQLLTSIYRMSNERAELVLMSEASNWLIGVKLSDVLGDYERGEHYAFDIIQDVKRHTNGWIDWNMALDTDGGPSYIGNRIDSPVIIDSRNDVYYKQPMYYAIAHFSRYFTRGSTVVDVNFPNLEPEGDVVSTGVVSEDGQYLVVAIVNRGTSRLNVSLEESSIIGDSSARDNLQSLVIKPRSINTYVIKL